MFNGVPVLSVVLVCAAVFLCCVAADDCLDCECLEDEVRSYFGNACSFIDFMVDFYKLENDAKRLCPDDGEIFRDLEELGLDIEECIF